MAPQGFSGFYGLWIVKDDIDNNNWRPTRLSELTPFIFDIE